MKKIVIGSRGSRLAMIQTESVAAEIRRMHPGIKIGIKQITTHGDRQGNARLEDIAGSGVFTKELEEALLERRIDMAVHSLKDMTTDIQPQLKLAAVMPRIDPADVLISRGGEHIDRLAAGAKIGTGSLRRSIQLGVYRPDIEIRNIRGNIDTRMRKVKNGEYDGVILAAAALKRLKLEDRINQYLPIKRFLPAVGQGALAIEVRSNDDEVMLAVSPLNHLPTWCCITAERAFLKALGGGCRAPIAALGTVNGRHLRLEGMVGSISRNKVLQSWEEGEATSPEETGIRLANKLLAMGGSEFIAEVRGDENG
jgi:hydroxymethylbilane synthase